MHEKDIYDVHIISHMVQQHTYIYIYTHIYKQLCVTVHQGYIGYIDTISAAMYGIGYTCGTATHIFYTLYIWYTNTDMLYTICVVQQHTYAIHYMCGTPTRICYTLHVWYSNTHICYTLHVCYTLHSNTHMLYTIYVVHQHTYAIPYTCGTATHICYTLYTQLYVTWHPV